MLINVNDSYIRVVRNHQLDSNNKVLIAFTVPLTAAINVFIFLQCVCGGIVEHYLNHLNIGLFCYIIFCNCN